MYRAVLKRDGSWECACRIQDGTERSTQPNRAAATRWLKRAAKAFNGAVIAASDISYYREVVRTVEQVTLEPM